jgi:hypothetical protein
MCEGRGVQVEALALEAGSTDSGPRTHLAEISLRSGLGTLSKSFWVSALVSLL